MVGFEIDQCRAAGRNAAVDATRKVEPADLTQAPLSLMTDAEALAKSDFYIVTVPTLIDGERRSDLRATLDRAWKPNGINLWRL